MTSKKILITHLFILAASFTTVPLGYAEENHNGPSWSQQNLEELCSGFAFTEGPVLNAKGTVFFTDMSNNRIYALDQKKELWLFSDKSACSNGLAFDRNKKLLACEQANNRLVRYEDDGSRTVLADQYEGKRLNNPNDLCVAKDGSVFFSDPPYGGSHNQPVCGVYRIYPDNKVERVLSDLLTPNGVEISPENGTLYAADTLLGRIWACRLDKNLAIIDKRIFARISRPDGMAVDKHGNVYIASYGQGTIRVFDPQGNSIGAIEVPPRNVSNCAFDQKSEYLYITAGGSVYRIKIN